MYKIIKDLANQCGNSEFATKSGYYIVEDLRDGRVEIAEYNSEDNTWGDNIQVEESELIIDNKVYDTYTWANETYPELVRETREKLENSLNSENNDAVKEAVDYYLKNFANKIFAKKIKENGLGYIEIKFQGEDADCALSDEAFELFTQLQKNN